MAEPLKFYSPQAAQLLFMAQQIRAHERASPQELNSAQEKQLFMLLLHAWQYSPYWKAQLQFVGFDPSAPQIVAFQRLPALTRQTLQSSPANLRARWPALKEDRILVANTSGSTGVPVRVEKDAEVYSNLYSAISWIEGLWHHRDPRKRIASLGIGVKDGNSKSWGGLYESLGLFGPGAARSLSTGTLESHLHWLTEFKPDYLKCSPSIAADFALLALDRGIALPLEQILSQSERVTTRQRDLCRKAFGATIVDRYSCEESGWIALPCPSHHNLHVLSATVLVEIVDDAGNPCPPGKIGRVLITSLHSFAMPLIRYEIGDLAEWGPACGCGMTLPVIGRLWGRIRHQLQMPDGSLKAMAFLGDDLGRITAIREFRILQYRTNDLEIQVQAVDQLSDLDRQAIHEVFAENGLGSLPLRIREVEAIVWDIGRKREEFQRLDIPFPAN